MKTLKDLTNIIKEFCDTRDWKNDDPNQLISSMLIELGELAEHYQWENHFKEYDDNKKREMGYEFVDILFYLLRIASKSDIDIEKYFDEKIIKLEKKFPIGADVLEQRKLYREKGLNKIYE